MADLPLDLGAALADRLARALDVEGKIPRVLEAVGGRDVVLVDGAAGIRAGQLADLGARVTAVDSAGEQPFDAPDASADAIVACWSAFRGDAPDEIAQAERILRPGGRLLVVHDYGRDDVSLVRGVRPEYGTWSRRNGPFLGRGFKIRALHCFWTFDSMEDLSGFLHEAFGDAGLLVADSHKRPRLSYNVAIYHRAVGAAA